MIWQDIVIAIGQALFAVALIPALLGAQKPPRTTCAMTGTILLVFAFTFFTLQLWWAMTTVSICGALWLYLLWQQRRPALIIGMDLASGHDTCVMIHAGCGGEVVEDPSKIYKYDSTGQGVWSKAESIPAYRCKKCGTEIIGDPEIDLNAP